MFLKYEELYDNFVGNYFLHIFGENSPKPELLQIYSNMNIYTTKLWTLKLLKQLTICL